MPAADAAAAAQRWLERFGIIDRKNSRLDELNGLSFERFDPQGRHNLPPYQRQSLEAAYDASRRFAETLDGWVVLQGGYGCGKTHLAAAIANHAVGLGVPTLFLTVPDLLDSLRYTFQSETESFEERFEQVRSAPLLVLDDLGTQNATDWAREKLFQILNHRHTNRLPTVLTTNLPLDQIDGRIRSRLLDASQVNLIQILAPDYRLDRDQVGHERLSSLHLHRAQSFANFSTRDNERLPAADLQSLRKAFEAARAFAEDPQGWLVFTGPYGSGKSHLAAAIANHCAGQGIPVMFVLVPDLLDHLRQTFSPHSEVSFDRRFDEVRAVQVLVLDDLGTQATTPWAREKLFQILTHRYHAALPTVITTADDLETIDARLRSRMLDRRLCTVHALTVPSYFVEGIDRSGRPKARRR
jgi:DNA replication protein DnaC